VVGAVWALRILLDVAGAPLAVVKAFSVTVAVPISILLATLLIHVRRFGGHANVVFAALLLSAWGELLIVAAILISVATGWENIYTAPEFSPPNDTAYHTAHMMGHLTFGIGFQALIGSAMGCILLFMLRRTPSSGSK
jgi:hypothetical protein